MENVNSGSYEEAHQQLVLETTKNSLDPAGILTFLEPHILNGGDTLSIRDRDLKLCRHILKFWGYNPSNRNDIEMALFTPNP